MEENDERFGHDGWEEGESAFGWEWRVMLVSAAWAVPGGLAGGLLALASGLGGPAELWLASGAVLGAVAGGLLEADRWPLDPY